MTTSTSSSNNNKDYDVFISHRGPDLRKTFASHLYHRLRSHLLKVFLDESELQGGGQLTFQIERAIRNASVHVALFSPRYAESRWCLNEVHLMLESSAPIIPVFYHVMPFHLRQTRSGDGEYARAFRNYEEEGKYDPQTTENWRTALSRVADIRGYELEACNGDEGVLLNKVVQAVLEKCKKTVFINHRGPDVKKTFASHLYHLLQSSGMVAFLDKNEMQGGGNLTSQIEDFITSAAVHIAIFSPRYAESMWCLNELLLMLESGAPIIPVFYHVKPTELRWTRVKKKLGFTRVKTGVYAHALHKLKNRYESTTIEKWRSALSDAAAISGLDLEAFNGDEGELVSKVVERVLDCRKRF